LKKVPQATFKATLSFCKMCLERCLDGGIKGKFILKLYFSTMVNRINGDFDTESIEAFRMAYAQSLQVPEDIEIDEYTGLPTDTVINTSPWIQHTGLWKANPGNDPLFQANQSLVIQAQGEEEEELTEEELELLLDDILEGEEEEYDEEDQELELLLEGILESRSDEFEEDMEDEADIDITVDELEDLLDILEDDLASDEAEGGDSEIDNIIAELMDEV